MTQTKSKFAGMFDSPSESEPEMKGRTESSSSGLSHAPRPVGRPPGKRSDPAWKQFSILLRRDTQREAAAILHQKDEGQDLSGLVQTLLERWVQHHKP